MKKRVIIFGVIVALTLSGCNKDQFLDQPLKGRQKLDDFFSSGQKAEQFTNSVYQMVDGPHWYELQFFREICEMSTDDAWAGNTGQPRPDITGIAAYNVYAGSAYINFFYENNYIGVTRANIALDRIPGVDMDPKLKKRLIAECKFLRAWFYFDLTRNYGGVPLVTSYNELLKPSIRDKKRSTKDQCYDFCEEQLKEAIPDLPLKSEYAPKDLGRATKGAAQTLLSKVYLYREKYAQAKTMAEKVMQSGQYQLEPDFADIWSVDNHHGVESIFEVENINNPQFNNIGGYVSTTSGSRADQGFGWCVPSSDLENAFLSENDSIRLRSTIIKNGDPVYGDPDNTDFDAAPDRNKSGRINRKFYIPIAKREDPYKLGQHPLDFIRFRYADVLLIDAEASYFTGDRSQALSSLKQVRDRVKLKTDISLSGSALRDAIWKERRLELALEQQRLFDIRREKIDGVPRIAKILGPNGSFVKYNTEVSTDPYETTNLGEAQDKGILFDPNVHMVWPIPPKEIQLSKGNITQNPGY